MRRILALVLSSVLIFSACSTDTWQSEIDVCVQGTQDLTTCYATAGFAIHQGCRLEGYQAMAAIMVLRVMSPDGLLATMTAEGYC